MRRLDRRLEELSGAGNLSGFRIPKSEIARAGFTLLEIILAIAIIALLTGVLVSASSNLLTNKSVTPEEVFWKAVVQSRQLALKGEREVRLSFDPKEKNFVIDDAVAAQTLPVPPARDLTIDFLPAQTTGSTILIGGELVDSKAIPFVTFYNDGTCSPFRAQFRNSGAARILAIDPWTCAKVLPKLEGTP